MKVGLFIDSYFPMIDGVAMVVDNYAKRLSKHAEVVVFAPKYKNFKDDKFPYRIVRCKAVKVPFLDYVLPLPLLDKNFKKEIDKYKLDIVHIHSPATIGMLGVKYAKKNNIPLIGTLHSQYKQDFQRAVKFKFLTNLLTQKTTKLYDNCDEVWTMNKAIADIFKNEYGYKGNVRILKNATDMKLVDKKEAHKKINKLHNIQNDEKVFLFVGRLNKLKNIFFIIDALKYIKSINYKMLFVGTGQDEEKLKEYVEKNNLNDKVIFAGRVADRNTLASYYSRADLFLFPSMYDTNALVQIEAASQKTPTLFLKGSVTASYIKDNENGFLCDNDPKKYAKKIENIMNDKKLYQKVSEKAYKEVYITWDEITKEVLKLYKSHIGG